MEIELLVFYLYEGFIIAEKVKKREGSMFEYSLLSGDN